MDIYINIDKLEVKVIESSSGIFSGENYHYNWSACTKSNQGLGSVSGDSNTLNDSRLILNDPDYFDMPVNKLVNHYNSLKNFPAGG